MILETTSCAIGYQKNNQSIIISKNINLHLTKGKLIALVGANGIGKSTLLRTITAVQKPISGDVLLYGKNIYSYPVQTIAKNISVVFTEKLPPNNLSVYELVALGRQPYTNWLGTMTKSDMYQVTHAIECTGIDTLINKKYYELSDGQLQRVLIARALAQDTPIIVLDEPTTHLDLLNKINVLHLLKKLATETNKCILFSTHDIEMAIEMTDEMMVMNQEHFFQNTPHQLIKEAVFSTLFDNQRIVFDGIKRKFLFV